MGLQSALRMIYPPQCLSCRGFVTSDFGLCGQCWRETPFITGLCCDSCGLPVPGEEGEVVQCDDCLRVARPWARGRAAVLYKDNGRSLVLSLKHGDRLDIARPASEWMARAAAPIIVPGMIVAPVPLHWWRMLTRRYNQAALLARGVARLAGLEHCPDLLIRPRSTGTQNGLDHAGRHENMQAALRVHPRRRHRLQGRHVLVVDDVMTSGATFAAAAEALLAGGAAHVSVLSFARVAKEE